MIGWWRLRSVREQRLLLVMAILFVGVLLWLGVVRPLAAAFDRAKLRQAAAVTGLAEARAQAAAIAAIERGGSPRPTAPITVFVGGQAQAAGFGDPHVVPAGAEGASITLGAVRPQAFFAWIARLEREQGVIVETLNARANSDATLTVQATLRVRSH
jgi:general secretion pathway protein M